MTGPTIDLLTPGWRATLADAAQRPLPDLRRRGHRLIDEPAETVTAGCAVASLEGAVWEASRCQPSAFHDVRFRALFEAGTACTLVDVDDRVWDCALEVGLPVEWVAQVVRDRPVHVDLRCLWSRRVLAAAADRRRAEDLIGGLEDLGLDIPRTVLT